MSSRIAFGLTAACVALGIWAGTASAGTTIMASAGSNYTFEPGPYVQGLGEIATFDNTQSTAPHDVSANQLGPDGRPLFFAEGILGGQTAPVQGTQYLPAGTYPFYCNIHGAGMNGELIVDGSEGKIVPRPAVKVSFAKQKLKQLRKSGVRVKIKALTASKPVTITASKGKVLLGVKRGLNLAAGKTRTLTVPLTKEGRKAVRKGKVVKIKLKATVPWGKPSVATRKVR